MVVVVDVVVPVVVVLTHVMCVEACGEACGEAWEAAVQMYLTENVPLTVTFCPFCHTLHPTLAFNLHCAMQVPRLEKVLTEPARPAQPLTAKLGDLSFWFFSSAARLRLRLCQQTHQQQQQQRAVSKIYVLAA